MASIFKYFYSLILDSLFPLSLAEKNVLSYSPEQALKFLPPSPPVPIRHATAVFAYKNEMVKQLVWHIKYKKSEIAVGIAGYALWNKIQSLQIFHDSKTPILILPIPLTSRRYNERGYNQCELIVDELIKISDSRLITKHDVLIRTQYKTRQTDKSRSQRLESARGIFAVDEKVLQESVAQHSEFKNKQVIIIDDVITTGSTMKEAMETMRKVGFENVYGLGVAH